MKLRIKIIIHFLFWFVFSLFSLVFELGTPTGEWPHINNPSPHYLINLSWAVIIFYFFYFYVYHFFEKEKFLAYFVLSILSSIVLTILFIPLHKFFNPGFNYFNISYLLPPLGGTFIIAQCGCLIKGFEGWFNNIQIKNEIENRNLRNELDLLKSKINPHFLFNSLNNIDSLINSSPRDASKALITLSDMLRYMIYESDTDRVPLSKEIIYIRNYINLQQLRLSDKDSIKTSFPDLCEGILIAPMLLIPFIENAFKYVSFSGKNSTLEISINCKKNILYFKCTNTYNKSRKTPEPGGFGLENVRRRLSLLYPNKHTLNITDSDAIFNVQLIIQPG